MEQWLPIVMLGLMVAASFIGLLISILNGEMKKFVLEKICEAEKLYPASEDDYQNKRLAYVIGKFKEKYKIASFVLNVKKFIELICQMFKPKS